METLRRNRQWMGEYDMEFEEEKQPDEDIVYKGCVGWQESDLTSGYDEEEEQEWTESYGQISESNHTDSVDDMEESNDETPRSSEKSARVVTFDEHDQIIESPSKKEAIQMVDLDQDK